jgi:ribonucleotide reductase alpha subunit
LTGRQNNHICSAVLKIKHNILCFNKHLYEGEALKTSKKTQTEAGKNALDLTDNSLAVLKARYLGRDEKGEIIETPEALLLRVAAAVAAAEKDYPGGEAKVEAVTADFYKMMADGTFMPNSPTLMNAGPPGCSRPASCSPWTTPSTASSPASRTRP